MSDLDEITYHLRTHWSKTASFGKVDASASKTFFFCPIFFFYKPQGNDSYLNPPPTCSAFSKIERNYGFELSLEHNNDILVFNSFKVNPIWMINIGIIEMKSFLKWCFSANHHQRKINCKFRLRDSLLSPRWRQICTYYRGTKWDFNLVSI